MEHEDYYLLLAPPKRAALRIAHDILSAGEDIG
jgi:hypothetical protein